MSLAPSSLEASNSLTFSSHDCNRGSFSATPNVRRDLLISLSAKGSQRTRIASSSRAVMPNLSAAALVISPGTAGSESQADLATADTTHNGTGPQTGSGNGNLVVSNIIAKALEGNVLENLKSEFLCDEPNMKGATKFFLQINEEIKKQNLANNSPENQGCIPPYSYETLYEEFVQGLTDAVDEDAPQQSPAVVPGVMPMSELPEPSLLRPNHGTPTASVLLRGAGRANTPATGREETQVHFQESTPTPAERFASMLRGSPPQPGRASMPATTLGEDPRDAQIRELQAQLAELRLAMNPAQPRYNLRSQAQIPVPAWGIPGYLPEPPQGRKAHGSRKGRGQSPNMNYWEGQHTMLPQAYYAY
ncbi:hypothetical protein BDV12DRAFT_201311 [Aspergillus spectabilis]